jgi:hypothetical protein
MTLLNMLFSYKAIQHFTRRVRIIMIGVLELGARYLVEMRNDIILETYSMQIHQNSSLPILSVCAKTVYMIQHGLFYCKLV